MDHLTYAQSVVVRSSPQAPYDLVSDVTRTGEWSPVCLACWWDEGRPGRSATGSPRAGLHTLRHSAASVMLTKGVPLNVVSEILGHSSIAITGDVYGHVAPDEHPRGTSSAGKADLMVVKKVVKPLENALRDRPETLGYGP